MGSPITLSGFNQIDFTSVLNAIMQQESQPLQGLQRRQNSLNSTGSAYTTLATKLATLQSATSTLSTPSAVTAYSATSSDSSALSVTGSSSAQAGQYDVVISQLAHAQVTASASTAPDTDTTVVASGGSLTIGGVTVALSGPTTLGDLATAINGTSGIGVQASVVETSPGAFRLVLTGSDTGAANAFTIQNALTGGSGLAFTDTNFDGSSGDSAADNALQASDASVTINNLAVTSSSNTLSSGIPGVTLDLLTQDPAKTVRVTVSRDTSGLAAKVTDFVSAYNDLVDFADEQAQAAGRGSTGTLGHDSVLRSVRNALRSALSTTYGSGSVTSLAEVGIAFTRDGRLSLNETALADAVQADSASVTALFAGSGTTSAFGAIDSLLSDYTNAGGFIPSARTQITQELSRLGNQIADMQARLAVRRTSLQQQFTAADQAMSRLSSQSSTLSSFQSQISKNSLSVN